MSRVYKIHIWKTIPFLRLLLPVITGIILQYYLSFSLNDVLLPGSFLLILLLLFKLLPVKYRFKLRVFQGVTITLFMVCMGAFLTWHKDIRNDDSWYGKYYDTNSSIVVKLVEPPTEKPKSYKALARVECVINKEKYHPSQGNILLYFEKDSGKVLPAYGDRILLNKDLQLIKNSGNPGAFNYKEYSAFQQLFHQAYLKNADWLLLEHSKANGYQSYIFSTRDKIVSILNEYIPGKNEKAIAIALFIGYKIDLDQDLVQAYSNAGIVHIIAISGMHMAIIYAILVWIFSKVPFVKKSKITRLILTLFCLWFFALLTGASGSVLRAAVMFSFIAVGPSINKSASIYNSMAASAFILLCWNPYLLWDVGFQLSYCAVLGIVVAQRHISHWFYFKNKLLRIIWQLISVSLSAQLFTFPICIYYFHQFPLLFLLSNLIAIPLSTIALWACIILVAVSPLHFIASLVGKFIFGTIWLIDYSVLFINAIPFSLWDNIFITVPATIILYAAVCGFLYWLMKKKKTAFKFALVCSLIFSTIITLNKWKSFRQKKLIVYNVPSHEAIDFINGNNYSFLGDKELEVDGVLKNFHLKPARISLMAASKAAKITPLDKYANFFEFFDKRVLLIDSAIVYAPTANKINVDYIIISKNPKVCISQLAAAFNAGTYIFDSSNPLWKIQKWKKDCEELHLRFHSVPEQGAFITDL